MVKEEILQITKKAFEESKKVRVNIVDLNNNLASSEFLENQVTVTSFINQILNSNVNKGNKLELCVYEISGTGVNSPRIHNFQI